MKRTYQLEELNDRSIIDAGDVFPAQFAVIGYPVKHSASPEMHQPALDKEGIEARYIRVEVQPGKVEQCFRQMEALGFQGCNVTVPHKLEAMSLCAELSDDAMALGATNTISFTDKGWIGHNTDGPGLAQAILEDFSRPLGDMRVLLLGAGGGAGRAIATQCAREGCSSIYLSNRTVSKLDPIVADLENLYGAREVHAISTGEEELIKAAGEVDLIVNATSLGLKEEDGLPIPEEAIEERHFVYDAVYNPPVTRLLSVSKERGAKVSNGLSMLIHQGRFAFEQWTGILPEAAVMRAGVLDQ